ISFFFSSRRRHTRSKRDWSSDVCSSDLTHRIRFTGRRMAMSGFIRRYASNYAAVAGLVILLLVIVIALVAPFVYASPWDMVAARSEERRVGEGGGGGARRAES